MYIYKYICICIDDLLFASNYNSEKIITQVSVGSILNASSSFFGQNWELKFPKNLKGQVLILDNRQQLVYMKIAFGDSDLGETCNKHIVDSSC